MDDRIERMGDADHSGKVGWGEATAEAYLLMALLGMLVLIHLGGDMRSAIRTLRTPKRGADD